jgi:hypothetical protein
VLAAGEGIYISRRERREEREKREERREREERGERERERDGVGSSGRQIDRQTSVLSPPPILAKCALATICGGSNRRTDKKKKLIECFALLCYTAWQFHLQFIRLETFGYVQSEMKYYGPIQYYGPIRNEILRTNKI